MSKLPDDGDPLTTNNLLYPEQKKNTSCTPVDQATDNKLSSNKNKSETHKSSEHIKEKRVAYRGFGHQSLLSGSTAFATENDYYFVSLNKEVDPKTSIIQTGHNILNVG